MTESTVRDGYTCSQCGKLVPLGDIHICKEGYKLDMPQSFTTQTIPLDTQLLSRIAFALERIAETLESMTAELDKMTSATGEISASLDKRKTRTRNELR